MWLFRAELQFLEVGWGIFAYSIPLQFLDAVAEGPETFEAVVPGIVRLVGLVVILGAFLLTTEQLRETVGEHQQRLGVINRVLRHNVRNDLVPVVGALEHFRDQSTDDGDRQVAERALDQTARLQTLSEKARLANDILLRAGRESHSTYDLDALVADVCESYDREFTDTDVRTSAHSTAAVSAVDGLEAAIENAVENACAHNDSADPVVMVATGTDGPMGTVTVEDNGSGIPQNELAAVGRSEIEPEEHGSGIGLWLIDWVVDQSGGNVAYEYDGGQQVRIQLPRADLPVGRQAVTRVRHFLS